MERSYYTVELYRKESHLISFYLPNSDNRAADIERIEEIVRRHCDHYQIDYTENTVKLVIDGDEHLICAPARYRGGGYEFPHKPIERRGKAHDTI